MSDQTTMNGRQRASASPAAGVGRNAAGLIHDLICLAELQWQLIAVDVREGAAKSLFPIVLIVGAILLALGTMPVALAGIGWALINLAGFSEGMAFLTVSVVALVIAAGTVWWGIRKLRSAWSILTRSHQELNENVRWVKLVLKDAQTGMDAYRRNV